MSEMPDTYIEILGYLRDAPDGLNTRQILSTAQKKRCFILGNSNNTDKISSCAFAMRKKKLITSSDGKGGKIHKITQLGLERLAEIMGGIGKVQPETANSDDNAVLIERADEIITVIQSEPPAEFKTTTDQMSDIGNLIESIRIGLVYINDAANIAAKIPPHKIADKRLKISVLEKLEPLYNDEISRVLGDIRRDLEQLEAE